MPNITNSFYTFMYMMPVLLFIFYLFFHSYKNGLFILMPLICKTKKEEKIIKIMSGPFFNSIDYPIILSIIWYIILFHKNLSLFFSIYKNFLVILAFVLTVKNIINYYIFKVDNFYRKKLIWILFYSSLISTYLFGHFLGSIWEGVSFNQTTYIKDFSLVFNFSAIWYGITSIFISLIFSYAFIKLRTKNENILFRSHNIVNIASFLALITNINMFLSFLNKTTNLNIAQSSNLFFMLNLFFIIFLGSLNIYFIWKDKKWLIILLINFLFSILFLLMMFSKMFPYVINSKISETFNVSIYNLLNQKLANPLSLLLIFLFISIFLFYEIRIFLKNINKKTITGSEKGVL